jgi:hypothetical protein
MQANSIGLNGQKYLAVGQFSQSLILLIKKAVSSNLQPKELKICLKFD